MRRFGRSILRARRSYTFASPVLVGLVGALLGAQALEGLLYSVGTLDAATLAATSLLILLIGVAASWIPAYLASSLDPVETLAES